MVRVTHVITRLIVGGAQENTAANVIGLLGRTGWFVELLSGPTTGPEGSLERLFEPHPEHFTVVPELIRPVRPAADLKAYFRLKRWFLQHRPEIVHTHSGKAGVIGRLAASAARVPVVIHSIHGPSFGPFQGRLANLIFTQAERVAGRATTHFITVAQAMTDQYLAAGIGKAGDYTRIFSGFNLGPFLDGSPRDATRARLGIQQGEVVVGKIARMFTLKGHDDLFQAAPAILAEHPKVKFLLVGGGEWEPRFRAMAKEMGLEGRFIFTGLVPPVEIPALIHAMDLLVHLSRREGLARALSQSLASGIPVVAYDCDGAREVCLPDQTGFLIQPGDTEGVSRAVSRLAADPALRSRLGAAGQRMVQAEFSVEGMVERIFALYQKLLRGKGMAA
jgi:glycosyltransferase involved in cell wall biosynthesis